ncbi:MAG TPA: sensor histidine kinase [Solirubrobacteraceae bacterium]|nr:sensor histidine kinase [Solirubrobacteraceae bacterium]
MTAAGSAAEHPALEAIARALMVGVPIGVGVYARTRPASARFGTLLVLTGGAWFLTTLSESSDPWLHALGRIAGWLCEPLLIYLVLAFPTGRVRAQADRLLVAASVAIAAVLYVPTALIDATFPEPSAWSSCSAGCPDNPLLVLASEPAFLEDVLRPLREVLTVLLFAAVCVRLVLRLARATHLMRRVLEPVLVVAIARFAAFAVLLSLRAADPDSAALPTAVWAVSLCVPLMALAFLAGIARWHLFIADALQHLGGRLAGHPGPEDLQAALAETFEDPSLQIIYPDGNGSWSTDDGRPVYPPSTGSDRWLTMIRDDGLVVAAILHDASLRDEEAFIESARAYTVLTLDNRRLGLEAAALLDEVRDSRMRIQASADEERRRVERDLHDGAQQRLVALRIKLELAAERINGSDELSARLIRELGGDVDSALDEIRSLARGIYPSPLADRGLVEALRSAALQTVLPATVHADGTRDRYPRPIESAAYFCCLEAMQNAAKHAEGAKQIVLELSDNGVLLFEVRDDGQGFDLGAVDAGVGLTSMRDRLAAVGGELVIVSAPGKGTRVIGRIPLGQRLPRAVPPRGAAREF